MTMTICPHCGGDLDEVQDCFSEFKVCRACGNKLLFLRRVIVGKKDLPFHAKHMRCECGLALTFAAHEEKNGIGNQVHYYIGECACGKKFKVTDCSITEAR